MEKEIGKHVEDAEKKTRTSVDESEEICENIEKAKNAVKTRSGQFFKESIEVVEKSHEDLKKANDQRKEVLENAQVLNQEKLSRVKSEYEGVLSDLLTKLKEEPKSSTEKQLEDLTDLSRENVADLTEKMSYLDEEVTTLVWEDLKVYQPTGKTPARLERQYPRYLASTDPHHRILEKFRKDADSEETSEAVDRSVDSELSLSLDTENKPDTKVRNSVEDFSFYCYFWGISM